MKHFTHILTEYKNVFIAYHNTQPKVAEKILATRFKLQKKIARKRLYGNGIYFTNRPDPRWGPTTIQVEIKPKNPLMDLAGNSSYEGNPLGDEIEAIGKTLFKNFHMSNSFDRGEAIEQYLDDHKIDMFATNENDKTIYVVRDDKIIRILGIGKNKKFL
jgi:hypothetical protein